VTAVGQLDLAIVPVDSDDLRPAEAHVGLPMEHRPHGVADVDPAQPCGGDLVEERLEGMEVVAVDDGDLDVGVHQAAGGGQPAETGPDHDDVRPAGHGLAPPRSHDRPPVVTAAACPRLRGPGDTRSRGVQPRRHRPLRPYAIA
jgi:hypothetical protein